MIRGENTKTNECLGPTEKRRSASTQSSCYCNDRPDNGHYFIRVGDIFKSTNFAEQYHASLAINRDCGKCQLGDLARETLSVLAPKIRLRRVVEMWPRTIHQQTKLHTYVYVCAGCVCIIMQMCELWRE